MPAVPPERPGCPKAPGGRRPLPDPAAIQLFLVPETAPPYDEDVPAGETGGGRLPARPPRGTEPHARGGGWPPAEAPRGAERPGRGGGKQARGMEPLGHDGGGPAGRSSRGGRRGAPADVPGAPP